MEKDLKELMEMSKGMQEIAKKTDDMKVTATDILASHLAFLKVISRDKDFDKRTAALFINKGAFLALDFLNVLGGVSDEAVAMVKKMSSEVVDDVFPPEVEEDGGLDIDALLDAFFESIKK